jgi:hypothetical protein
LARAVDSVEIGDRPGEPEDPVVPPHSDAATFQRPVEKEGRTLERDAGG